MGFNPRTKITSVIKEKRCVRVRYGCIVVLWLRMVPCIIRNTIGTHETTIMLYFFHSSNQSAIRWLVTAGSYNNLSIPVLECEGYLSIRDAQWWIKFWKRKKNVLAIWWIGTCHTNLVWIHLSVSEKMMSTDRQADGRWRTTTDDGHPCHDSSSPVQ